METAVEQAAKGARMKPLTMSHYEIAPPTVQQQLTSQHKVQDEK